MNPADESILMISGDANILLPESAVAKRTLLMAQQVKKLTVFVQHAGESKFAAARRMFREARKETFAIVTAQDPFFLGFIAWRIARKQNAKLQLQVHTDIFAPGFRSFSFVNRIKYYLARFLLRRADGVRVVSEKIKQSLVPLRLRAPVAVLPIFLDKAAIEQASPVHLHARYGEFDTFILVASRLEPEKDVLSAINAMPSILKVFPHAGLLVAGEGSMKKILQQRSEELGIAPHVVFLGWRSDTLSLYKSVNLLIATPATYESYGATTVEALAAGCPVISPDAGVAREAGAVITTRETIGEAAIAVLTEHAKGELKFKLYSPDEYAEKWRETLTFV